MAPSGVLSLAQVYQAVALLQTCNEDHTPVHEKSPSCHNMLLTVLYMLYNKRDTSLSQGDAWPVSTAEPQSLWQKVLPAGRTLGRTPSTLSLEPEKLAIGISLQGALSPGVAEHVGEAGEYMTNGRTLLGMFCREH